VQVLEHADQQLEAALQSVQADANAMSVKPALAAITSIVPMSRILMGSDNPYVALVETADGIQTLGLTAAELRAIRRENALALLPTLASK